MYSPSEHEGLCYHCQLYVLSHVKSALNNDFPRRQKAHFAFMQQYSVRVVDILEVTQCNTFTL